MRDEHNKAQAAIKSFMLAMHALDRQYVYLLERMGCKQITLHRF